MFEIDARGKACPMPVVLAKKALDAGENEVLVRVDNAVAVENLRRLAASTGRDAQSEPAEGGFAVTITGAGAGADCGCTLMETPVPAAAPDAGLALFIGKDHIGEGDLTLGRNLMRMFFLTLAEGDTVPKSILFMNGGVLLPVENEQVIEALRTLEARGAEILVCGTCLSAFDMADRLRIGTVSNMYEIQKRLLDAGRVISFG